MSVRIHQLAKDIGFKNEALVHLLRFRGFEIKSVSSMIDDLTAERLRAEFKDHVVVTESLTHENQSTPSDLNDADAAEISKSSRSDNTASQPVKMKIALNLKALEEQPWKFAPLLREIDEGPTEFSARGKREEFSILKQFVQQCLLQQRNCLIYRRWAYDTQQTSQFVLRPHPNNLSDQFEKSRLAFVCQIDESDSLKVIGAEARSGDPVEHLEQPCDAELVIPGNNAWATPVSTDAAGIAFIKQLPEVDADFDKAASTWTHYLDWRQKLAERKANELYTFKASKVTARGKKVELILEDPHVCEMIKQRLNGETVRLYTEDAREELQDQEEREQDDDESRAKRTPPKAVFEGVFKWVYPEDSDQETTRGRGRYNLRRKGSPTGQPEILKLCVEAENDDENPYTASDIPEQGILKAAMEGELAAVDVQRNGLRRLAEFQSENPRLRWWLFDPKEADPCIAEPPEFVADGTLNEEQLDAVKRALALQNLLLLWGPPGTGKTTVIAEIASQYCRLGCRVLISSQANLAVEQALERLPQLPHIRPARISTSKQNRDKLKVHENMHWWLLACAKQAEKSAQTEDDPAWQSLLNDWKDHVRNKLGLQDLDEPTIRYYRKNANVIGATCSETGKKDFYNSSEINPKFDLSIVDEVSKATPPELILPALLGKRTLLVGDHRQLPPVFRDTTFPEAVENGEITDIEFDNFREMVTTSYFKHLFESVDPSIRVALQQQYRMHPQIMDAVNQFYADQPLRSGGGDEDLARRKAHSFQLTNEADQQWLKPGAHLVWIDSTYDVRGQAVENQRAGTSRFNEAEADLCVDLLRNLIHQTDDIGIISLYRAQILQIQSKLRDENAPELRKFLEAKGVNTVDQFQGSERDIIIVSLTRTDDHLSGEFIKDFRRINVAISRARKLLIVIGRQKTFDSGQVEVPAEVIGQSETRPAYMAIREIAERHGIYTTLQAAMSDLTPRKPPHHSEGKSKNGGRNHHSHQKHHKSKKRSLNTPFDGLDQILPNK
jgi:hypothetical protein